MIRKMILAGLAIVGAMAATASPAQAGHGRNYVSVGVSYGSPHYYYDDDYYYPRHYRGPVYYAPAYYYDDYPVYRRSSYHRPRYYYRDHSRRKSWRHRAHYRHHARRHRHRW